MSEERYIKVILPLNLGWEPYYRVGEENVQVGDRVSVLFSGRRYVGVVSETDATPDIDTKKVHSISGVERRLDPIDAYELKLWHFLSDYYLCPIGEVYKTAYPSLKTAGEEAQAHAEERKERAFDKKQATLEARIQRLEALLSKKEDSLKGKHNASVTERLTESRDKTAAELKAARQELEALSNEEEPEPEIKESISMPRTGKGEQVRSAFNEKRTVLVCGGKDRIDVLIEAAADTISAGEDVLFLVPDIALSKKLQARLRTAFGQRLRVFHSGEKAAGRRETAQILRQGDGGNILLGTRSALFLPFKKLGLVIVEEEHDIAFKQMDGVLRFNGRDTAVMLASIHNANVLLSSPTPSMESFLNVVSGRYTMVETSSSFSQMEIIDTSEEKRKNGMIGSLSRILIKAVDETLANDGRVLILRPWGPLDDLKEELAQRWQDAMSDGRIAIATVYEAKRMSLDNVDLLALIGSDILLDKQDFRADERAIQTFEQFRGRLEGRMLIQTSQGQHQVFQASSSLVTNLLSERKAFGFPPYTRLIDIKVFDNNEGRLCKLSSELKSQLSAFRPLGPYQPMKGRKQEEGVRVFRITLQKNAALKTEKRKIADIVSDFVNSKKYPGHIFLDIDPI